MVESNEAKDQINTRTDAIKEDLKNPSWKDNKASNVMGDLTKDKNEVKTGTLGESMKNTAIDTYEGAKESIGNAAQYASDTIRGKK